MKLQKEELFEYIKKNPWDKIWEMAQFFGVTNMTIHRHITDLCNNWLLIKRWSWPQTIYQISKENSKLEISNISIQIRMALDSCRYQINKVWQVSQWVSGFAHRCWKRNLDFNLQTKQRYNYFLIVESMRDRTWCIDATKKLNKYGNWVLKKLWYQDIYARPQYGKSKQWTFLEVAKIQPTIKIFGEIITYIRPLLQKLIILYKIDAVCFVKPTMSRKLQIMNYLEKNLSLGLPVIAIKKVPWFFPPQKSLSKMEDRIINAQESFQIEKNKNVYNNVLLIDDAVWSGATLVELAKKLKYSIARNVFWYAITGTANWLFDEISKFEVFSNV
jgi:hypothetical protein